MSLLFYPILVFLGLVLAGFLAHVLDVKPDNGFLIVVIVWLLMGTVAVARYEALHGKFKDPAAPIFSVPVWPVLALAEVYQIVYRACAPAEATR